MCPSVASVAAFDSPVSMLMKQFDGVLQGLNDPPQQRYSHRQPQSEDSRFHDAALAGPDAPRR